MAIFLETFGKIKSDKQSDKKVKAVSTKDNHKENGGVESEITRRISAF